MPYLMLVRWLRELKIVRMLRLRLLSGLNVSSWYWMNAYVNLRRLRSEDISRKSLHAFGQGLVPAVVSVVVKGCRILSRHRRAGKIRREICW